eukprot:SAG11_NODE_2323_length_3523_cov_5.707652_3_plen_102_part_00
MSREIPRCLRSGAWVETQDNRWVSKAFLVPKPGFKTCADTGERYKAFRLVWDFRHVNCDSFCRELTTRFETLSAVRHLARQGDWMVSCDLEDGYHAVGIHP